MLEVMLMPFFSFNSWHIQSITNGSSNFSDVPWVHQNSPSAKRLCCTCKLETKGSFENTFQLSISQIHVTSRLDNVHLIRQIAVVLASHNIQQSSNKDNITSCLKCLEEKDIQCAGTKLQTLLPYVRFTMSLINTSKKGIAS